jgi:hypothetical protein
MSRTSFVLLAVLVIAGCRLPEHEAVIKPLPEGQSFAYQDLLVRSRAQAMAAVEAFYVDAWADLADAAAALEQTSRFLPKTTQVPESLKDKLGSETDQLRQDAMKLGDAARAKDSRAVNEALQRINLRIRVLCVADQVPPPPPVKAEPTTK